MTKEAEAPSAGGGLIPVGTAAKLLMISERRIQQLVREGYIPAPVRGRYQLVGVVQGYIRSLTDEKRNQSRNQHENAIREARRREIEQRIAEKDGRLIELEEHDAVLDEVVGMAREGFGGLPARLSRDPTKRREIEDHVASIFADIADRLAQRGEELRAGGTVSEAGSTDDA